MWWSTFGPPQTAAHAALRGLLLLRRLYPDRRWADALRQAIEYVASLTAVDGATDHRRTRGARVRRPSRPVGARRWNSVGVGKSMNRRQTNAVVDIRCARRERGPLYANLAALGVRTQREPEHASSPEPCCGRPVHQRRTMGTARARISALTRSPAAERKYESGGDSGGPQQASERRPMFRRIRFSAPRARETAHRDRDISAVVVSGGAGSAGAAGWGVAARSARRARSLRP